MPIASWDVIMFHNLRVDVLGRELRIIDKEIFRAIDWEEEKERGRRMAPLRPPGWAEYYYRKVPSPIAPNSDGTEDANETIPSILGER